METWVNDIIKGAVCELCGQAFKDPKSEGPQLPPHVFEHGHPAVCHECWTQLDTKDKRDRNRAMVKTFGG